MLTLEDCIALSELSEDEVEAIAEHEHVPEIIAAELGNYLIHSPEGVPMLKRIFLDDIQAARERHDLPHVHKLILVLRHFIETHPDQETAA